MDAVQQANSGHPETPMAMAPFLDGSYLNIGRIGVPTWPVFGIYQIRPNHFGWSINEYLVVNKSITLFR
jgi:hypothetical protein